MGFPLDQRGLGRRVVSGGDASGESSTDYKIRGGVDRSSDTPGKYEDGSPGLASSA